MPPAAKGNLIRNKNIDISEIYGFFLLNSENLKNNERNKYATSPGGEIGRRTGLKILGPEMVVPVQVWPGAPSLHLAMRDVQQRNFHVTHSEGKN